MPLRRLLAAALLVAAWLYLGYLVWQGQPPVNAFMLALGLSIIAGFLWGPGPSKP
jgi:hypothetical protein